MKIAVISGLFFPSIGGAEIVIHNIMKQYGAVDIDATLFIPHRYYAKLDVNSFPYKIKPFFVPRGMKYFLNNVNLVKLYSRIIFKFLNAKESFDVWHAHDASFAGYILALSGLTNTVLTFHGSDIQVLKEGNYGHRLNKEYERRLENIVLPNINICTAISKSIKQELINLSFNSDKIEMVPNGLDLNIFEGISKSRNELRSEFGFKKDEFIILTSGRNHPKKGYKYIPLIAKELESKDIKFKWIIVGRKTEEIQKQIDKLGVKSVILKDQIGIKKENPNFTFPDENLRKIYKMVDCYAFPTLLEGLPLVILEAFASKLPVMTTNAPGVEDFDSCVKINIDDDLINNFAIHIEKLISDKIFSNNIICNQYKELESKYTLPIVVNKYKRVYQKIMEKNDSFKK